MKKLTVSAMMVLALAGAGWAESWGDYTDRVDRNGITITEYTGRGGGDIPGRGCVEEGVGGLR
jgi:hypothetical protein